MTPILSYLLKANITLVLLYGFYFAFFRRDTFYGHIRWYFLTAIVSAMLFPAIDISAWLKSSPAAVEVSQYILNIDAMYQYMLVQSQTVEPVVARTIPLGFIMLGCWLSVTAFMMGKRVFQFVGIVRLWRRYPQRLHRNSAIIAVDKNIQPFSFFGRVFVNPALHSDDELDEIITHEQVHCRQRHSIDNLLAEALVCLFWFNPVAWWLRRDLKQNLEYYTDRITLTHGFDRKRYQYSLLRVSLRQTNFQIVNHFHFNNLKKRIAMLNKKESSPILTAKYLLVVPALAAALLVVQASGLQAKESDGIKVVNESSVLADIVVLPVAEVENNTFIKVEEKPIIVTPNIITSDLVNDIAIEAQVEEQQEQTRVIRSNLDATGNGQQERKPLYVVDGKVMNSDVRLNDLKADDIESISVLKGENAAKLFGEAAASGVIVITTKTGANPANQPSGTIRVSGAVTDNSGKPSGHTLVVAKGMPLGVVTDMNGRYSINVPPDATLIYAMPQITREIAVENRQVIDVVMEPQQIQPERIGNTNIIVRGQGFEQGVQPLYIIDGVDAKESVIENLSLDNIESISVLKGENAIARYGERGRNGVIVITTKK